MEGRTAPVHSIGVSFGIVETVSPNGGIRGLPQRRGFESRTILFRFRVICNEYYEVMIRMRKKLIFKLSQMYTRTFSPLTPNGNNAIGNAKRTIIAWLMFAIGGKKTKELLLEVLMEFNEWYESHKGDLA